MSRVKQKSADKGSQRWLQQMVERAPHAFEQALLPKLHPTGGGPVEWLSPRRDDDYAEYSDGAFLRRLDLKLGRESLKDFWPKRGPVWDGLARTARGDVLLIEAKANMSELASPGTKASEDSAKRIRKSLAAAKPAFGAPEDADWASTYYQYANRLAHLYLLRQLNHVSAYLVFLYFVNATEVGGPTSVETWQPGIKALHEALRLGGGPLTPYVLEVFVDIGTIGQGF